VRWGFSHLSAMLDMAREHGRRTAVQLEALMARGGAFRIRLSGGWIPESDCMAKSNSNGNRQQAL